MDLRDASSYFSADPVYDGYTGAYLFDCHTSPHDDHTSSGATSRRRTMVTAPDTVPPARAVVTLYGEQWLVGTNNPDSFMGQLVRRNYDLKKSTGLMAILTPAEACMSALGTEFHAHKEYFKDGVNPRAESEIDNVWTIFCPPAEPVAKGTFLRQGSILYRVRNTYPTAELLNIAQADQLDTDAIAVATFEGTGEIDLVTDRPVDAPVAVPAIQTDLPKFYRFRTLAEAEMRPGDRTVFVPKSLVSPAVGHLFSMLGQRWQVAAVASEQDCWALHARLA